MDDGPPRGSLVLGTMETAAALRLSPIVSHFARMYPQVRLSLTTGISRSLAVDVAECRLDGAFIAGPLDHPDLHSETIFREELVLVTPRTIRSLESLTLIPHLKTIVFRVGCLYRQQLEALLVEGDPRDDARVRLAGRNHSVCGGRYWDHAVPGVVTAAAQQDIIAI